MFELEKKGKTELNKIKKSKIEMNENEKTLKAEFNIWFESFEKAFIQWLVLVFFFFLTRTDWVWDVNNGLDYISIPIENSDINNIPMNDVACMWIKFITKKFFFFFFLVHAVYVFGCGDCILWHFPIETGHLFHFHPLNKNFS